MALHTDPQHRNAGLTSLRRHQRRVAATVLALAAGTLAAASQADAAVTSVTHDVVLDGAQVGAAGDSDGNGAFVLHFSDNGKKLCWAITVRDIDKPTAIRVHQGVTGATGPVVLGFKILPAAGDLGAAAGCVPAADPVLEGLRADAMKFYVEVATKKSPDGTIRGQLR
jgi:CHRD domain